MNKYFNIMGTYTKVPFQISLIKHVWYKVHIRSQMGLQDWHNGYETGIMPANCKYNFCQTELDFSSKYCISTAYLYYMKLGYF